MPKVTVLMPVYNGQAYLKDAMDSVLKQTFADFEFLIIDDRSNDASLDIVTSYKDDRIRLIRNSVNIGQMATLNAGIGHCRTPYIVRMDQDDTSLPDRIEKELEVMDRSDDIGLVYSDSYTLDHNGRRRHKTFFDYAKPHRPFVFDELLRRNFIPGNTAMIRKEVFRVIGFYNPDYRVAAEYDLYLRLARKYRVDFIDEPLAEYRVHGRNSSGHIEKTTEEMVRLLANFDRNGLRKDQEHILDNAISWHMANLATSYMLKHKRELSAAMLKKALDLNPYSLRARAVWAMKVLPDFMLDLVSPLRSGWME